MSYPPPHNHQYGSAYPDFNQQSNNTPPTGSPYPPTGSPYPPTGSPYPPDRSPSSPYPTAPYGQSSSPSSPYPPTHNPYAQNTPSTQFPTGNSYDQAGFSPYPAASSSPYPSTTGPSPYPSTASPYSPANTYNQPSVNGQYGQHPTSNPHTTSPVYGQPAASANTNNYGYPPGPGDNSLSYTMTSLSLHNTSSSEMLGYSPTGNQGYPPQQPAPLCHSFSSDNISRPPPTSTPYPNAAQQQYNQQVVYAAASGASTVGSMGLATGMLTTGPGLQPLPSKVSQVLTGLHGKMEVSIFEAQDLSIGDIKTSDPFAVVSTDNKELAKTKIIACTLDPVWNENFKFGIQTKSCIRITVFDDDKIGKADKLAEYVLDVREIKLKPQFEGWVDMKKLGGKKGKFPKLKIKYSYSEQMGEDSQFEVKGTYFPVRRNCHVTMYQDAHSPVNTIPALAGTNIQTHSLWIDINKALGNAKECIYIAGWSVYHEVTLLRGPDDSNETLGQLLTRKANEGVDVVIMVWDEVMSKSVMGVQVYGGVMNTHDDELKEFFRTTKVQVVLASRESDESSGIKGKLSVGVMFTHHQKTVLCDAPSIDGNPKRRLISFVGGIDLTEGRWDTPQHPIFSSLNREHKNDFYQPNSGITAECGPRQPWHDIHCKIEGPACYDILENFFERMKKQGVKYIASSRIDAISKGADPKILPMEQDIIPLNPNSWEVQTFRSIDDRSADLQRQKESTLTSWKGRLTDRSIQEAYAHHIRRAKRFIYIENQYFMGSCSHWEKHNNVNCDNTVPQELTEKICQKIRANERFAVYIVLPMYPEGVPGDAAIQAIIHWQFRTIQYMYKQITKELRINNRSGIAQDYINFFCLGQREPHAHNSKKERERMSDIEIKTQSSKRFMIYVHSKLMIVDDEVFLVGSANINERSMAGTRDSEIAVTGFQINHQTTMNQTPRGAVHNMRLGLWAEHCNTLCSEFYDPSSVQCVKKVRSISDVNWNIFSGDNPEEMRGHLMNYPLDITSDGRVTEIPTHPYFPDTKAKTNGSPSLVIPAILTT